MPQQKNQRILWRYYWDVSLYNAGLSVLVSLYTGPLWGMILYVTLGYAIALLCFGYFQGREYLFYRNWGWRRRDLFFRLGVLNLIVSIPLGVLLIAILWLL